MYVKESFNCVIRFIIFFFLYMIVLHGVLLTENLSVLVDIFWHGFGFVLVQRSKAKPCNFGDQDILVFILVKKRPWNDKTLFSQTAYLDNSSYSMNLRWPLSIFDLSPHLRFSIYSRMIHLFIGLLICSFYFWGQIFPNVRKCC